MALKTCKECGEKVSSKAKTCPACGAPVGAKRYGCGTLFLVVIVVGILASLMSERGDGGGGGGNPGTEAAKQETPSTAGIDDEGYFKDDLGNRVRTFSFPPSVSEAGVRYHAERLVSTSGRMMAAYYYPAGATIPRDGVTLAASMLDATDVIYETPGLSKWRYAFMRFFNGTTAFVDCEATPGHDLCKES